MRIFIAEKPSGARVLAAAPGAAKKGEGFLADGGRDPQIVTWCFGHMLEPAEPEKYLPEGHDRWIEEDHPIIRLFFVLWRL